MAQIVTITNPLTGQPAQVDQLEHTAQQIDDAIARALPGGDIDTLLAGKAPAGYGLGESHGLGLSNVSLNSLINNGWYFLYRNNTDGPDNVNISDAILFVSSARSDLTKVQRLTLGTQGMQGYELRRVYNNKSWLPWEWLNPPMKLGVEYRTTERYLGKPVYCMTKFVGEVAANTVTQVVFTSSDIGEYCIRAFCTGKRTSGNWEDSTTSMVSSPSGSVTTITCDPMIYRLNEGYRGIRAQIKSSHNLKDVYCTAYYTKWAD